jgi:hypothetical protein
MICFDERKRNKNLQGLLTLQGMDIVFIVNKYSEKELVKLVGRKYSNFFLNVELEIKNTIDEETRDFMLREASIFKITFKKRDIRLKKIIKKLSKESILYTREKIFKIIYEGTSYELFNFEKIKNINNSVIDLVRYQYELNTYYFTKYTAEMFDEYSGFSYCSFQNEYIRSKKTKLIEEFCIMGF